MRFVRSHPVRRRGAGPVRLFGAVLLAAGTLSPSAAAAGPAAAVADAADVVVDVVVEPVGQRYQQPRYDDVTTADPTPSVATTAGPTPSPSVATTAAPAPGPGPGTTRGGAGGSMAGTGSHGERLWLLGALAVVLAATGLVAKAAMRGRRIR
ncbi:hypothetical protein ACI2LJ_28550 [Streptomyces sp. NPDC088090]|uniref:hypothetical protein n=1 Tax=Streptomyces sp. NPDC088090 TaxID=3365822 RepID=UPI00384AC53F